LFKKNIVLKKKKMWTWEKVGNEKIIGYDGKGFNI
jgi:hypothetical protein